MSKIIFLQRASVFVAKNFSKRRKAAIRFDKLRSIEKGSIFNDEKMLLSSFRLSSLDSKV